MWKNELRNREFSTFCEYLVGYKLQELGWKVFRPLIDRYVDIVAIKKINGKEIMRTIQVKGSRVENEDPDYESYGLTHEPKDLLHSPEHFFVWVFIDKKGEVKFMIIPISEFIKIRNDYIPVSTRRKHSSLLMRNEWRHGTDRMHPHLWINHNLNGYKKRFEKAKNIFNIKNPSWDVEGVILDFFVNNWILLEKTGKSCFKEVILSQETDDFWRSNSKEILSKWAENNKISYNLLNKNKNALKGSKKLDETGFPEK